MKVIHHQTDKSAFTAIRGEKKETEILAGNQKDLLDEIARTLTIVMGGEFKRRRSA
ncbi:MAG: hypothetical protein U0X76_03510 [Bacteroidia bacterium]